MPVASARTHIGRDGVSNAEIKEAQRSRCPVLHMGIRYDYVSAVIYRTIGGEIYITAALYDRRLGDEIIVHAKDIEPVATE